MAVGPRPVTPTRPTRSVEYERSVLPNRLRVVSQHIQHARSVAATLLVGVGSRYEDDRHAGASHLIEHLVFKGTAAYPDPGALCEAVEAVGGSVNASTDREVTLLSAKIPKAHGRQALEALGEMAFRPLLRRGDLVAERPIVVDEIRMYEDSPGDHIFNLFDELLFGRHPLGREIAGSVSGVRRIAHTTLLEHWSRWYRPENMVLAAAGAIDHATLLAVAGNWTAGDRTVAPVPLGRFQPAPPPAEPRSVAVRHRPLAQASLCIGMPAPARNDPDRWALELLSAVLGDGMSSRLFIELRERRSLAYEVSTFSSLYSDIGVFGVYAGFDPDRLRDVVRGVLDQLDRVVQDPIPAAELEKARAYTIGRLDLRMEETGAVAGWLGHGELLLPEIMTLEEVVERLESVTADELLRVARRYLRPSLARLAALGPLRRTSAVQRLLDAA